MNIEPNTKPGYPLTNRQLLALAGRARKPRLAITKFQRGKAMACGLLEGKMRAHGKDSVALRAALDAWWSDDTARDWEVVGPRFSWGFSVVMTDIASILQGDTSTITWNIARLPESERRPR